MATNKEFVQDLVKLIGPKNDPPTAVQEKVLSLIQVFLSLVTEPSSKLYYATGCYIGVLFTLELGRCFQRESRDEWSCSSVSRS